MSTIRSKDRASLCSFTFVDARRCRMPRGVGHPYLCAFHARKEAQALAGQKAAEEIAYHLSGSYVSACDLSSALGRLFSAVAQGQIKPKTASTLAYLAQTIVQNLHLAQNEYVQTFGTNAWRDTIRTSHNQSANMASPTPQPSPPIATPQSETSDPETSAPEASEPETSKSETSEPENSKPDGHAEIADSEMSPPKPMPAVMQSPASEAPSPTSS
jgi:hypothetical protein